MTKKSALFFALFLFVINCKPFCQNKLYIYADVSGNDTLQKLISEFEKQINKSSRYSLVTNSPAQYKNSGIYIANTELKKFPVVPSAKLLSSGVEAFSINADGKTVQLLGNSNMALGHAIFTYLESLGYRFYFANAAWHITPRQIDLYKKQSLVSKPSFDFRRIWYGYGTGSQQANDDYNFWVLSNKLGGSFYTYYGHAYEEIAFRNLDSFARHPEWSYPPAKKDVLPYDIKFDMTHEDLIQFITRDIEKRIELSLKNKTQDYKMFSLGPSDGFGTCNSPACQQLGTITDRVFYLVNRVAKNIRKKYPSTYIGCLAYGEYIPPPTKKVEPNVFVGLTTVFNVSDFTTEQLIDEWRKKGATVGIYDYFSWYAWDFDIPGQSLASVPAEMIKRLKRFYSKGVKAFEAESSIGWMSKGLGYYLAAKYLWDINSDSAAIRREFFNSCFEKAAPVMKQLWNEWENYPYASILDNDLAKWFGYIADAEKLEQSADVKKRLYQIKSYLHYLFLFHQYQNDKSESNILTILNYGYRKLDDGSVPGFPAFWVIGNNSGIKDMGYVDNAKWKFNDTPVTEAELNNLIKADKGQLKILNSVIHQAAAQKITTIPGVKKYIKVYADSINEGNGFWMKSEWAFELKNKSADNYFDFTGNFFAEATNKRIYKLSVYPYTADGNVSDLKPVFYFEYNSLKIKERVKLANLPKGFYTIIIDDPGHGFHINFSPAVNHSVVARPRLPIMTPVLHYSFIFVPEGTQYFNLSRSGSVHLLSPAMREVNYEGVKDEIVQIKVLKGEAGLWRIKLATGRLFFDGIPPFVGTSPAQMLIPATGK